MQIAMRQPEGPRFIDGIERIMLNAQLTKALRSRYDECGAAIMTIARLAGTGASHFANCRKCGADAPHHLDSCPELGYLILDYLWQKAWDQADTLHQDDRPCNLVPPKEPFDPRRPVAPKSIP